MEHRRGGTLAFGCILLATLFKRISEGPLPAAPPRVVLDLPLDIEPLWDGSIANSGVENGATGLLKSVANDSVLRPNVSGAPAIDIDLATSAALPSGELTLLLALLLALFCLSVLALVYFSCTCVRRPAQSIARGLRTVHDSITGTAANLEARLPQALRKAWHLVSYWDSRMSIYFGIMAAFIPEKAYHTLYFYVIKWVVVALASTFWSDISQVDKQLIELQAEKSKLAAQNDKMELELSKIQEEAERRANTLECRLEVAHRSRERAEKKTQKVKADVCALRLEQEAEIEVMTEEHEATIRTYQKTIDRKDIQIASDRKLRHEEQQRTTDLRAHNIHLEKVLQFRQDIIDAREEEIRVNEAAEYNMFHFYWGKVVAHQKQTTKKENRFRRLLREEEQQGEMGQQLWKELFEQEEEEHAETRQDLKVTKQENRKHLRQVGQLERRMREQCRMELGTMYPNGETQTTGDALDARNDDDPSANDPQPPAGVGEDDDDAPDGGNALEDNGSGAGGPQNDQSPDNLGNGERDPAPQLNGRKIAPMKKKRRT